MKKRLDSGIVNLKTGYIVTALIAIVLVFLNVSVLVHYKDTEYAIMAHNDKLSNYPYILAKESPGLKVVRATERSTFDR